MCYGDSIPSLHLSMGGGWGGVERVSGHQSTGGTEASSANKSRSLREDL